MGAVIRALTTVAVVVTAAAVLAASRNPEPPPRPTRPASPAVRATAVATPAPRAQDPERRALERTAVAYALAARNWSARTLVESWRRQRALTGGGYRRALEHSRPNRGQRAALAAERGSSIAILAAPPRARRDGPHAEVVVALHERTATGGAAVTATTRNRVTLRRHHGHWRVTGWTILPGGGGAR